MSRLIQIMACHLLSSKPSLAPKLNHCSLDPGSKLQWNLNLNKLIFLRKNAFENFICKISTILLSSYIDTSKNMNAMPLPTHMKSTQQAVNKHWPNQYIVFVTNNNPSTYIKIYQVNSWHVQSHIRWNPFGVGSRIFQDNLVDAMLLMPWLPLSPGHPQPLYWIYRINGSLASVKKGINYLCHLPVEK